MNVTLHNVFTSLVLKSSAPHNIRKIKTLSENVENVLWTVPGGIVADRTVADNQTESETENVRVFILVPS